MKKINWQDQMFTMNLLKFFIIFKKPIFKEHFYMLANFYRNSRPEVYCRKGVLRNFAKFTGKHMCQIIFFSEAAGLRPATLFKKRLWHRCLSVNFAKFLRTPFLTEHFWWLLLFLSTPLTSILVNPFYTVYM